MILLVTALYAEAKPFIEKLHMKGEPSLNGFKAFAGELDGHAVRLLLTGVGKLSACSAVTDYLSRCSRQERQELLLINVGTAAASDQDAPGRLCMAYRVTDVSSGRCWYPELMPHPFAEREVRTVDRTAETAEPGDWLFDMEAAGICEAVSHYLNWDQVAFLKCVSDTVEGEKPSPEQITSLLADRVEEITTWLCGWREQSVRSTGKVRELQIRQDRLEEQLLAVQRSRVMTVTMENELRGLLRSAACAGDKAVAQAAFLLSSYAGTEPAASKREEKQAFRGLCEQLKGLPETVSEESAVISKGSPAGSFFRHIYIERTQMDSPDVQRILSSLPSAKIVPIRHFKDVFNRSHQNFSAQKQDMALILARRQEHFVYPGAPVCQSFGNAHFYYTSVLMNCLYDCEYCYLQGMYPGGHMVAFVNLEDYFAEVEALLREHPVYLCVSFDTDLLAMERVLGYGARWCDFALSHPGLTIEIRTKGNAAWFLSEMEKHRVPDNVILAWTLSPETVIRRFEHRTAPLAARLEAMQRAMAMGFRVRACFDPAIRTPDFENEYGALIETVFSRLPAGRLWDASIGTFRISQEYLKTMRKNRPDSCIVQQPYRCEGGVAGYGAEESGRMMKFLKERLIKFLPEDRIFLWES